MKILVTFALETEFAPWRATREFRPATWGGTEASVAEINGAEVGVVLTGAGRRQAASQASRVIRTESNALSLCISSGLAGALRPQYHVAQILAARNVFSEVPGEASGEALDGVPEGMSESLSESDPSGRLLTCSQPLVLFAAECGATVVDKFFTSLRVVARPDEKSHLGLTADAVEMESFEILRESALSGIPAVAIRAVSDLAGEELPLDMNQVFTDEGQVSIPRVVGQLALHPQSLPGLVRLGQHSKRAATSLGRFLDRYIVMVVERMKALEVKSEAAAL